MDAILMVVGLSIVPALLLGWVWWLFFGKNDQVQQ